MAFASRADAAFSAITRPCAAICRLKPRNVGSASAGAIRRHNASSTSSALPTARPSGSSMGDSIADVGTPESFPRRIRSRASSSACCRVFMKAPRPAFTSSRMRSAPAASFLLMILLAIKGRLSIVAVTLRRP